LRLQPLSADPSLSTVTGGAPNTKTLRLKKLLLVLQSSLCVILRKILQSSELFNAPHEFHRTSSFPLTPQVTIFRRPYRVAATPIHLLAINVLPARRLTIATQAPVAESRGTTAWTSARLAPDSPVLRCSGAPVLLFSADPRDSGMPGRRATGGIPDGGHGPGHAVLKFPVLWA